MQTAGIFQQAFWNLGANRQRSVLTMFGITWGIGSVIVMVSLSDGFQAHQARKISAYGKDLLMVWGGRTSKQTGGRRAGRTVELYLGDVQAIRDTCSAVGAATPELSWSGFRVVHEGQSGRFNVSAIMPEFQEMRLIGVRSGRLLREDDLVRGARVCLLGSDVVKQLFGSGRDPVGESVRLGDFWYRVVGVLAEKAVGTSYFGNDNTRVLTPFTAGRRDLPQISRRRDAVSSIMFSPVHIDAHEEALRQVRCAMAARHGFEPGDPDAIEAIDTVRSAGIVARIFTMFRRFFWLIGGTTLAVGAVGVMNIMLITVAERTREIGIRRAIGATRNGILIQFLMEAATLVAASGMAGIFLGASLVQLLRAVPLPPAFARPELSCLTVAAALLALAATALASGLYPALRASRLTPVEALRAT